MPTDKEFLIRVKADIQKAKNDLDALSDEIKKTGDESAKADNKVDALGESFNDLNADTKKTSKNLKKTSKEISKTGKASNKAEKQVNKYGKSFKFLGTAVVAYLSFDIAKRVILQADAYNVLQQRIKTATRETGDYVKVSRELFAITQSNGVQLETTVSLYQNLARSAPDLQATTDQMLTLTDVVQQLGVISGASDASLNSGLIQFSQGLSAGIFRAEEFNSLLENIPEVANRIAIGMGKTTGELRKMVVDGKVLSKDVFDALVKQAPEIADQFAEIPLSVERAATNLSTSFSQFLGQLDEATGLTEKIAKGMQGIADSLTGKPESIANLTAELTRLKIKLDSINEGEVDRRGRGGNKAVVQSSIDNIIEQINQSLISDGGPVGLRLALDAVDNAITLAENDLTEKSQKLKGQARKQLAGIRTLINELKAEREQIQKELEDVELADDPLSENEKNDLKTDTESPKKINAITNALKQQSETVGFTAEQMALYKLKILEATPAQLALAQSFIDTSNAQSEANKIQQEAAALYADTRTEQEKLSNQLARYDTLLAKGAIDWDTYSRAVFNTNEEFDALAAEGSTAMDTLIAATKGWGDQFTNTLADMVQTGKLDFKSLADSIISDLLRIAIQQTITAPILGAFGVSGFPASTAHTGGIIGSGSAAIKTVNPAIFSGAKRYHGGGIAGLKPNEVPTILERGEEVLTRNDPRHKLNQGASGKVSVEIIKNGTPVEVSNSQASFDINGMVVKVFLDDLNRGGPIRRAIKGSA